MNEISRDLLPFLDKNGRLISLPTKHKKKLLALWYLAGKIEAGRAYSEPEINDLLDEWTLFHGPATLRRYIRDSGETKLTLRFDEIGQIAGVPLDHSFLKYKAELLPYGYAVGKISMKGQTVQFVRKDAP